MTAATGRSGVCRHGALRRSCETCDLAEDLAAVEAERDALRRDAERWKNECYLMAAHQAGDTVQRLLDERDALRSRVKELTGVLAWIEPLYDDTRNAGELAMRLYDACCCARQVLNPEKNT